jgi:hypothetical protein
MYNENNIKYSRLLEVSAFHSYRFSFKSDWNIKTNLKLIIRNFSPTYKITHFSDEHKTWRIKLVFIYTTIFKHYS